MKRNTGVDYTRVILTLIIVLFHFANSFGLLTEKLFYLPNGTYGWGSVGAFTVMSGYLLRGRYKGRIDLKQFYSKRLLTLFPSFYVAFLLGYIVHSIQVGSMFYGGHPAKIIFTFLGIDSYVGLYGVTTYAIVGEWYTGIIIIVYLLFPFLNMMMEKLKIFGEIGLIILFGINTALRPDQSMPETSVITAVLLFYTGMIIAEYKDVLLKYSLAGLITLAMWLILIVVPMNFMPRIVNLNLASVFLFMTLMLLFGKTGKIQLCNRIILFLSTIAYEIYLIHHFVMYQMLDFFPETAGNVHMAWLYYIILIAICVVISFAINQIAGLLIKLLSKLAGQGKKA